MLARVALHTYWLLYLVRMHSRVHACGKSGASAAKVTVRPDYCRDVLIERF